MLNIQQFFLYLLFKTLVPRPLFSGLCSFFLNILLLVTIQSHGFSCQFRLPDLFPQHKPVCWGHLFNCLPGISAWVSHRYTQQAWTWICWLTSHKHVSPSAHPILVSLAPHMRTLSVTLTHSISYQGLRLPPKYFSYFFPHHHSHCWHLNSGPPHFSPRWYQLSVQLSEHYFLKYKSYLIISLYKIIS